MVLAMALLGPAPAVALAAGCALVDTIATRRSIDRALVNLATYSTFSLAGGVAIQALVGDFDPHHGDALWFAGVVLAVFLGTNTLNFLMVAAASRFAYGVSDPRCSCDRSSRRCRRSSPRAC